MKAGVRHGIVFSATAIGYGKMPEGKKRYRMKRYFAAVILFGSPALALQCRQVLNALAMLTMDSFRSSLDCILNYDETTVEKIRKGEIMCIWRSIVVKC